MDKKEEEVLGRDPFAGMEQLGEEVPPPEETPPPVEKERRPLPGGTAPPLVGKGVWLSCSADVQLAVEMAGAVGATHIICKAGHRGMFFVEAAQRVHDQVRAAGFTPLAWFPVHCDDPKGESETALKSLRVGYEGVVFDLGEQAAGRSVGAATLGRRLLDGGVDPGRLYYASYPNIWQHPDIPYREMNGFCRGGFMPKCYPTFQRTPRTVINKWAYGEHERWSAEWGDMPPLYPILAGYREKGVSLTAREFLEWVEALAAHDPPFFSVHRAMTTDRELWPILASVGEPLVPSPVPAPAPPIPAAEVVQDAKPPMPEAEPALPPAPEPEPEAPPSPSAVYHTITVNDTVWTICMKYGISRDQFWEWNGHLWDEHGLPRDTLYLQEGWRVRVA